MDMESTSTSMPSNTTSSLPADAQHLAPTPGPLHIVLVVVCGLCSMLVLALAVKCVDSLSGGDRTVTRDNEDVQWVGTLPSVGTEEGEGQPRRSSTKSSLSEHKRRAGSKNPSSEGEVKRHVSFADPEEERSNGSLGSTELASEHGRWAGAHLSRGPSFSDGSLDSAAHGGLRDAGAAECGDLPPLPPGVAPAHGTVLVEGVEPADLDLGRPSRHAAATQGALSASSAEVRREDAAHAASLDAGFPMSGTSPRTRSCSPSRSPSAASGRRALAYPLTLAASSTDQRPGPAGEGSPAAGSARPCGGTGMRLATPPSSSSSSCSSSSRRRSPKVTGDLPPHQQAAAARPDSRVAGSGGGSGSDRTCLASTGPVLQSVAVARTAAQPRAHCHTNRRRLFVGATAPEDSEVGSGIRDKGIGLGATVGGERSFATNGGGFGSWDSPSSRQGMPPKMSITWHADLEVEQDPHFQLESSIGSHGIA